MVQTLCSQAFTHDGGPCMATDKISQTVLFPELFDRPVVATFDREQASSDGGAVLLKAAERVYGLVKAFAGCLADKRAPGKIRHTLAELTGQRIFGIACGHPDGNDAGSGAGRAAASTRHRGSGGCREPGRPSPCRPRRGGPRHRSARRSGRPRSAACGSAPSSGRGCGAGPFTDGFVHLHHWAAGKFKRQAPDDIKDTISAILGA